MSGCAQGGNATGGNATGGNSTGGSATGGNATGGGANGGNVNGGSATGGNATGGSATGGYGNGGRPTGRVSLGIIPSDRIDAAIARDRDGFIADLRRTIDVAVKPIADISRLQGYRENIQSFSNRWSLGFVWHEFGWISGSFRGYPVTHPHGYMANASSRKEHLGIWRAADAGFMNKDHRVSRWLVTDTLYEIMEYLNLDD